MGWKDAPLIEEQAPPVAPRWASAPVVDETPAKPKMAAGEAFVRGGVDAIPFGQKATALGTALALKAYKALSSSPHAEQLDDSYAGQLEREQGKLREAEEDQSGATLAGRIVGGGASAAAVPLKAAQGAGVVARAAQAGAGARGTGALAGQLAGRAGQSASLGSRLRAAAGSGGVYGLAHGAGAGEGPVDVDQALTEGAIGAGLGAAGHLAGDAVVGGGKRVLSAGARLKERLLPSVKPTEAALALEKEGVELTAGRLDPDSVLGRAEELAKQQPTGAPLLEADARMRSQVVDAALRKAMPDAMEDLPAGGVASKFAALKEGFKRGYGEIAGEEIYPAIHRGGKGIPLQGTKNTPGAFDQIVNNKGFAVAPSERRMVADFLEDQLGRLPDRKGAVGRVPVERLIEVRSAVRELGRDKAGNRQLAKMIEAAEDAVTESIESQVPAEMAEKLAGLDKKYSNLKVIEDAIFRAKDGDGMFTPNQLDAALKSAAPTKAAYIAGNAELQPLATNAIEVLKPRMPLTGLQAITQLPGGRWVNAAVAHAANTPKGKAYLLERAARAAPVARDATPSRASNVLRSVGAGSAGRGAPRPYLRAAQLEDPDDLEMQAKLAALRGGR